jgi:bifunctional non-homologous end joining protein LigD
VALKIYREKRRFDETPEPRGKSGQSGHRLRFVVQMHRARRLHYDFRLELDGVLKSWAVPKGPSLNPEDKRLAVMVEDHPLEYRTFEGVIPEGNYGAGTVMVWDQGTYEPLEKPEGWSDEQALLRDLDKGHLRIKLHGDKLRGSYSLVRTKTSKNWLMFKRSDSFASKEDVTQQNRSAATGRSIDEIRTESPGRGDVWHSNRSESTDGAADQASERIPRNKPPEEPPADSMPRRVKPMLATLVEKPFDRPGWLFEVKWDGYRAIAEVEKDKVRLYSRKFQPFENKYRPVVQALAELGHDAVIDGEIVVLDDQGVSQFELLQKYQQSGRGALIYYVFDLLYLDGQDLRKLPLIERKEKLARLVRGFHNVRLSEHVEEKGIAFYEAAKEHGLEGIMAKQDDCKYLQGVRSQCWLKLKIRKQQEAVIGGFTEPRGERAKIGALVIGVYEGDDLIPIGKSGSGFNDKSLAEVHAKLEPLIQKQCPFKTKPKTDTPATWVKPALVCEIAFQNWTSDGIARMPIFLGLREDRDPKSVVREKPQALAEALAGAESKATKKKPAARRGGRRGARKTSADKPAVRNGPPINKSPLPPGRFTNLNKVYWPEDGYTKRDLLVYYHEVAPILVPHLRDRPLSLNRHPDGIHGPNFFQKNVGKQKPPDFIETVVLHSGRSDRDIEWVLCQNEPTLLYVANLGCIEINPFHSRVQSLERPDYLVIDLDPQDVPFAQVVEAAQGVRRLLEKGSAECYCKTSGKRGLHVYVPMGARYDDDQVRQFAELIANLVQRQLPETTSVVRNPAQRRRRVYLDFLQNRKGQTIAAPYSVRPVEGAMVSTPLDWSEVNAQLDPAQFTIRTVPRRLDKVGDLWQPVLGPGIDLRACLAALQTEAG